MKGEISDENVLYIVENINVAAIETTLWSMDWAIYSRIGQSSDRALWHNRGGEIRS